MPSRIWIFFNNMALAFIMSVLLSICLTVGQGQHLSLEGFGFTFAVAFVTSIVVAFLVPLPRAGSWFIRKMGFESGTGVGYLVDSALQVLGFLVIVNLVMTIALSGVGMIEGLSAFDRWWIMNMQFWAVAYLAFLVARPLSAGFADKLTTKKGTQEVEQAGSNEPAIES